MMKKWRVLNKDCELRQILVSYGHFNNLEYTKVLKTWMYQNGKLEQKSVNVIMKVVLKIDFGLEVDIAFNKLLNMCTFSVHKRS